MDCDFLIIDSFNRHEFGTGVGREVNHPLNGLLAYDKRTTVSEELWPDSYTPVHEFDHIPDKLPANYYLDATRAITRLLKPETERRYVTSVQFPTISQSKQKIDTWVWQDVTTAGAWHETIDKPADGLYIPNTLRRSNRLVTKDEFTNLPWSQDKAMFRRVTITGIGLGSQGDNIEIHVNDLMDDYDATDDQDKGARPWNILDNNCMVPSSAITVSASDLSFSMPTLNPSLNTLSPGLYSIQVKNSTVGYQIVVPFVVRVLPD